MTDRRIVMHAGLPKTGTSALQVAFVRNREALERAGVHYPVAGNDQFAAQGLITTGNAGALRSFLVERDGAGEAEVAAQLADALGHDRPATLFSSEILYFSRGQRLARVHELVRDAGAELDVVLYVRNLVPWVVSYYGQRVKRHRFTGSLGVFLDEFEPDITRIRGRIETFVDALGQDRVQVLHYESHRADLVQHFLADAVGVPVGDLEPPGTVNRALTARELEWMRLVNQQVVEDKAAWQVSDAVVHHPKLPGDTSSLVAPADVERIRALGEDHVRWVNEQFFGGEPTLTVEDPAIAVGDAGAVAPTPAEERLLLVGSGLADRMVTDRQAEQTRLHDLRQANHRLRQQLTATREERDTAQRRARRLRARLQEQAARPGPGSRARALAGRVRRRLRRATG
jgi:hypothetical protein